MGTRKIAGVVYHELSATNLAQDAAIRKILADSNIKVLQMRDKESASAFVLRIVEELIENDAFFRLLGCFLVPEGKKWSREVASESAEIFRNVTDNDDKAELRGAFMPLLDAFFRSGLSSVVISRRFSDRLRAIVGQPRKTEGRSSLESGRRSFGSFLVGILTARFRWLTGPSVKPS